MSAEFVFVMKLARAQTIGPARCFPTTGLLQLIYLGGGGDGIVASLEPRQQLTQVVDGGPQRRHVLQDGQDVPARVQHPALVETLEAERGGSSEKVFQMCTRNPKCEVGCALLYVSPSPPVRTRPSCACSPVLWGRRRTAPARTERWCAAGE